MLRLIKITGTYIFSKVIFPSPPLYRLSFFPDLFFIFWGVGAPKIFLSLGGLRGDPHANFL